VPARLYLRGEPVPHPAGQLFGAVAAAFVRAIGVVGEPPDPATDFAQLAEPGGGPPYFGGSIQPLTLRQTAALLLRALPVAERFHLGAVFNLSADPEYAVGGDAGGAIQLQKALAELNRVTSPALDKIPVAPLFYLHATASQRSATRDLEDYARYWKQTRGIPERRVHTGKYAQYLRAWDLREGWAATTGRGRRRSSTPPGNCGCPSRRRPIATARPSI
jgi:hypothetical protein